MIDKDEIIQEVIEVEVGSLVRIGVATDSGFQIDILFEGNPVYTIALIYGDPPLVILPKGFVGPIMGSDVYFIMPDYDVCVQNKIP